jgi:hydrogenase maturation protein HypF
VVLQLLGERINCPASSALGRYFDAAAAILGVGAFNHFEAQAPIALEAAIAPGCDETLPFKISPQDGASTNLSFEIDLRPTVLELIARVDAGEEIARLAAAFHNTIAAALAEAAKLAADRTGVRVVAARGGVFCNRYLTTRLAGLLAADGNLELLTHRQVPTNDGGLALGQAAVAAAHAAQLAGIESPILTQ